MTVAVTSFTPGKKIVAIKGIRQATGLGLKESKDVADKVEAGEAVQIQLIDLDREVLLDEHGVKFYRVPVEIALGDFVEMLSRYPRDYTVGGIVDVLRVAATFSDAAPRQRLSTNEEDPNG